MLYSKQLEIIEENTRQDANKVKSLATIFYMHCLKWNYQKYNQGTSWIRTIITSSKDIKDILYKKYPEYKNTTTFNKASELLHDAYKDSIEKAIEETGVLNIAKDINVWKEFCTLEVICNEEYIRKWLISNAYSSDIIDKINNKK